MQSSYVRSFYTVLESQNPTCLKLSPKAKELLEKD